MAYQVFKRNNEYIHTQDYKQSLLSSNPTLPRICPKETFYLWLVRYSLYRDQIVQSKGYRYFICIRSIVLWMWIPCEIEILCRACRATNCIGFALLCFKLSRYPIQQKMCAIIILREDPFICIHFMNKVERKPLSLAAL